MSLVRIATVNALESASAASGNVNPDYPLSRLTDRNSAREMRSNGDLTVTGGTITTQGSYTVHTFLSSGTLVVSGGVPIAAEVLVVAGGGGGASGGGGGGEVLTGSQTLDGSMAAVVGGGGAGGTVNLAPYNPGANGGSSSFGTRTAAGGGGGGNTGMNGVAGGSSGGGASSGTGQTTSPAPTGSGYTGGGNANQTASPYPAGGGGGAGAAGADAPGASTGGNGGVGVENSLRTGSAVTYAGGGGGGVAGDGTPGTGGAGGGGNANDNAGNGTAGTANTGGGGGGTGGGNVGGAGGSGIVVVRYLTAALTSGFTRVYTWGPGMAGISVNALMVPAGHTIGNLAYTLAKSSNGTDWTTVSTGTTAAGTGVLCIEFTETDAAYWRLTLPTDADVIMAELLLTDIHTVARNPARPSGALQTDYNVKADETSAGSARYIEYGASRRVRDYDFRSASVADSAAIKSMTDALGMKKPFYLCDHEGAWIWGNLEEPVAPVEINATRRSFRFNFREVLG